MWLALMRCVFDEGIWGIVRGDSCWICESFFFEDLYAYCGTFEAPRSSSKFIRQCKMSWWKVLIRRNMRDSFHHVSSKAQGHLKYALNAERNFAPTCMARDRLKYFFSMLGIFRSGNRFEFPWRKENSRKRQKRKPRIVESINGESKSCEKYYEQWGDSVFGLLFANFLSFTLIMPTIKM